MEILEENMRESNYKLLPFKRNQLIFLVHIILFIIIGILCLFRLEKQNEMLNIYNWTRPVLSMIFVQ